MTKSSVFIVFLLLTIKVSSQPAIIVGSAIAEPGDTVSIPIDYVGTGSAVVAFQVDINFDNMNLNLVTDCNNSLGDAGIGCVDNGNFVRILVFGLTNTVLPNGRIGVLNFTVDASSLVPMNYPVFRSNEIYSESGGGAPPNGSIDGNIFVDQLFSVGGNVSNLNGLSVTLQNNFGDNLTVSANEPFLFPSKLANSTNYDVTVLTHPTTPNQTCVVTGGSNADGTGTIVTADVTDIVVNCNDSPISNPNNYTLLEDSTLLANDATGTINDSNDDSVLINDSDDDVLAIVLPGTFNPIDGIGGSLTINVDGTFDYTPPTNVFGSASFDFEVTDGLSVVASSLSIDVIPVNDQPSFNDSGNIVSFPFIIPPSTIVEFPNFVHNINLGPFEEVVQSVMQFNLTVLSDNNVILNPLTTTLDNNGTLNLDLTFNEGVAVLQVELVDDGGTLNGGVDTSVVHEFSVSYFDFIYQDGFEEVVLVQLLNQTSGLSIQESTIKLDNHYLELFDSNGDNLSDYFVEGWISEIESLESFK